MQKTASTSLPFAKRIAYAEEKSSPASSCSKAAPTAASGLPPPNCTSTIVTRPQKTFNISMNALHRKWAVVKDEVRKCDVLCADCHSARHEGRA